MPSPRQDLETPTHSGHQSPSPATPPSWEVQISPTTDQEMSAASALVGLREDATGINVLRQVASALEYHSNSNISPENVTDGDNYGARAKEQDQVVPENAGAQARPVSEVDQLVPETGTRAKVIKCEKCNKKLTTHHELYVHLQSHNVDVSNIQSAASMNVIQHLTNEGKTVLVNGARFTSNKKSRLEVKPPGLNNVQEEAPGGAPGGRRPSAAVNPPARTPSPSTSRPAVRIPAAEEPMNLETTQRVQPLAQQSVQGPVQLVLPRVQPGGQQRDSPRAAAATAAGGTVQEPIRARVCLTSEQFYHDCGQIVRTIPEADVESLRYYSFLYEFARLNYNLRGHSGLTDFVNQYHGQYAEMSSKLSIWAHHADGDIHILNSFGMERNELRAKYPLMFFITRLLSNIFHPHEKHVDLFGPKPEDINHWEMADALRAVSAPNYRRDS